MWAVWSETREDTDAKDIVSSVWADTAWGPRIPVSDPMDTVVLEFGPRLASGGGKLWCVWFGGADGSGTHYSIFASCWDDSASAWGPKMQVSPSDGFSHWWGDVAVDTLGCPSVVWSEVPHYVAYCSRFDGLHWSTPTMLNDTPRLWAENWNRITVVRDRESMLHVAFGARLATEESSDVFYTRYDGQRWTPCHRVSKEATNDWGAVIAANRADDVWISWWHGCLNSGREVRVSHFDGAQWSPEERLDGVLSRDGIPTSICLDSAGLPAVAWYGGPVGTGGYGVFVNRYGVTGVEASWLSSTAGLRPSLRVQSPARRSARIECEIPVPGTYDLSIYGVTGEMVRSYRARCSPPGMVNLMWDGRDVAGCRMPTGTYICRLVTAKLATSVKIVLLDGE